MKTFATFLAAAFAFLPMAGFAEPAKPLVALTVKKQVIDSDHDLRGKQGSSKERTLTLKVEIVNVSGEPIENAQLSGHALVSRAGDLQEKIIKESLAAVKVPAMKPNERLTFDLGKLRLTELELRGRKFKETLEEWKVVCTRSGTEIGQAVSSERYASLEQQVVKPPMRPGAKRRSE
jgi:hypothetical protein